MAVLNLRNVPESLMVRLRMAAAANRENLHSYAVGLLDRSLQRDLLAERGPVGSVAKVSAPVEDEPENEGIEIT